MEEIKKVKRVIGKALPDAPHEVLLVLDANNGQNALSQVKAFDEALDVTGAGAYQAGWNSQGRNYCCHCQGRIRSPCVSSAWGKDWMTCVRLRQKDFVDALLGFKP